jgi:hypothetical protein
MSAADRERMSEAFVYIWYDALNKMYYLGKHKGSPDDTYTHSSTIWESFTKDCIPEGVTRRILAYGMDEEMCILEHELLVNRKNRCWNRYYNESLGDPRYVDVSGDNNPMYGKKRPEHSKRMSGKNNPFYGRGTERTGENNPAWKGGMSTLAARQAEWKRKDRAKKKAETGFAIGYSQSKKKSETQGEGTLKAFLK